MNSGDYADAELARELAAETDSDAHLDRRTSIAAIVITGFFWIANFAIQTLRSVVENKTNLEGLSTARLVTSLGGIALCFAIHLVIRAMHRRPFWQRAVALVVVVPPAADACAWISYYASLEFAPESVLAMPTSSATIQAIVYWVWFLLAWGALYLALRYSWEVQASERRARRIQAMAHAAQMRALHNQVNPHFMFNTLNSIAALILDGDRTASETMVTRLAEFLRATLAVDPLSDITFEEELRIQHLYLAIELIRFPDLNVSVSHDEAAFQALLPPLVLQPIVENAVKHGVAARPGKSSLRIDAHCTQTTLEISVCNERADRIGAGGLGMGLKNVEARLASHYGAANYRFTAGPAGNNDFCVRVSIPRNDADTANSSDHIKDGANSDA